MNVVTNLKNTPLMKISCLLALTLLLILIGCDREEMPYERTFKNTVIRNTNIEPIVESIVIEKTYDSVLLYRYWGDRLKAEKNQIKEDAYSNLFKAKRDYDEAVKAHGRRLADLVQLKYVKQYQQEYDSIQKGIYKAEYLKIYKERTTAPSIFEQITIRYKLSESAPLMVVRYRTDIFKGDTSFYELKENQTLKDYINGR